MIKQFNNRKGSAIAFALFIATVLLLSEAFLMNQNKNIIVSRKKNIEDMQSYFAARAGMQHAMLKAQIMPTQLYDAACFATGKNPFFDFTQYSSKPSIAFESDTRKTKDNKTVWIKLANNSNPGPRFLVRNTSPDNSAESWLAPKNNILTKNYTYLASNSPRKFLEKFGDDIKFDSKTDCPTADYPYRFSYSLTDFAVLSVEGQRKYNEEAVQATIVGKCDVIKGKSGEKKEYKITSIARIKREAH